MDDLISRQAAIDAISCNITVTGRQNAELVAATIGTFADRIKALPSAQPDRSLWFRIGEICVDESKGFISSGRAVEKIRELLRAERREDEETKRS